MPNFFVRSMPSTTSAIELFFLISLSSSWSAVSTPYLMLKRPAVVPAGRYQIDAQSDSGSVRIRGLTNTPDAPFQIQAMSTSGDVSVEAAS